MLCHLLTKLELTASASMAQRLTDDKVFQWVNARQAEVIAFACHNFVTEISDGRYLVF